MATLLLEVLDSRLLSVLTWYHLAFLAVSIAMLGLAAGAVRVFLGGRQFQGDDAIQSLPRYCTWFAISIPLSHIANLCLPIPMLEQLAVMEAMSLAVSTLVLATPFFLSGVVVTLGLTRAGGSIGRLYAADLLGASVGCLLFILLLNSIDISSVAFVAGAVAASAAAMFHRFAGTRTSGSLVLAALLLALAGLNATSTRGVGVVFAKGRDIRPGQIAQWFAWNTHSYVIVMRPREGPAFNWGPGRGVEEYQTVSAWMLIDGEAATPITRWEGDPGALAWALADVTAAPYHLRSGDVGIIGVGGGRDVLSAIAGGSRSITGIEINDNLIQALEGPFRRFAGIADRPDVALVHAEARSYLSRTHLQFDVLQMSLIDTWAATGAGAFTLSENGLYTIEAWHVFLNRLKPGGIFSISRWFSPSVSSETSRLLALGVAALIDRGVRQPDDQLVMLARGRIATLLVSNEPFKAEDGERIRALMESRGFHVLVSPWTEPADPWLGGIVGSKSRRELESALRNPVFDFSPPTDERPFFFNTLKPTSFHRVGQVPSTGLIWGNLRATFTLVLLFGIAVVLVVAVIGGPLIRSGLPAMDLTSFMWAVAYFALIGTGFMLIQIPLLQRFSVYLGHPTHTFSVILFSMIFFTGLGSLLSDRFSVERDPWLLRVPILIAVATFTLTVAIQPLMDTTIHLGLVARSLVVVGCILPIAVPLGFCFPVGMTLVGRLSGHATAWMWGVNGACGVLASITAVAISMWLGIHYNLMAAGLLYLLLLIPAFELARKAKMRGPGPRRREAS